MNGSGGSGGYQTLTWLCRSRLQTGDKWRHVPDVSSWLTHADRHPLFAALVCLGGAAALAFSVRATRGVHSRAAKQVYIVAAAMSMMLAVVYKCDEAALADLRCASLGVFAQRVVFM